MSKKKEQQKLAYVRHLVDKELSAILCTLLDNGLVDAMVEQGVLTRKQADRFNAWASEAAPAVDVHVIRALSRGQV